jgi:two-component system LytT family response regulator
MLQAIAIDDEPRALDVIRKFMPGVPFVELTGSFTHAFDAMAHLRHRKTDLLFLDIRMPDISGIDLVKGLADPPMVIFTTAYSEHAVQSFELNAIDYLLKPFSPERFLAACQKALEIHTWKQQEGSLKTSSFFLKSGYETIKVSFDQVLYAESTGNYVQFFLKDRTLVSRLTMGETEKLLLPPDFIRIHRRFIIARGQVTKINKKTVLIGGLELPVGETYGQEIEKLLMKVI